MRRQIEAEAIVSGIANGVGISNGSVDNCQIVAMPCDSSTMQNRTLSNFTDARLNTQRCIICLNGTFHLNNSYLFCATDGDYGQINVNGIPRDLVRWVHGTSTTIFYKSFRVLDTDTCYLFVGAQVSAAARFTTDPTATSVSSTFWGQSYSTKGLTAALLDVPACASIPTLPASLQGLAPPYLFESKDTTNFAGSFGGVPFNGNIDPTQIYEGGDWISGDFRNQVGATQFVKIPFWCPIPSYMPHNGWTDWSGMSIDFSIDVLPEEPV